MYIKILICKIFGHKKSLAIDIEIVGVILVTHFCERCGEIILNEQLKLSKEKREELIKKIEDYYK